MVTALLLPFLLQRPSMVAAQTSPLLGEAALTLPQSWTGPDSVTQVELAEAMPPFALLDSQGEFSITRVEDAEGPRFRVLRAGDGQAAAEPGHLHFAWTVTGDELSAATGQVLNITLQSYNGSLDFGIISCPHTVPDLKGIADAIRPPS